MFGIDFSTFSLWINLLIFAVAAAVIWFAGTRIAGYADAISAKTGLTQAFVGLLFLALATEMPEIGTTVTAAVRGNASLAVNNLFGGVVMQTAILAVVDIVIGRGVLTFFTPKPTLLLQGMLLALLLSLTLAAMTAGEVLAFWGIGVWTVFLFCVYVLTLYLSYRYEGDERWHPDVVPEAADASTTPAGNGEPGESEQQSHADWSLQRLILFFIGGSILILAAGMTVAQTGEAFAEQTGLGATFVGATLLAISTSLPELSTSIAAARLGNYSMAISNIFGSNAIMVALLFVTDIAYRGGPLIGAVEAGSTFMVSVGLAVTCIYLIGLVERRNLSFFRMGLDSLAVLIVYPISLVILYTIR